MRKKLIIGAMGVQLAVLLAMVARQEWILHSPVVVTLRTAPLDPQDPMRGDYANFHFEIADVPRKFWSEPLAALVDKSVADRVGSYWRSGVNDLTDYQVYAALAPDPEMVSEVKSLSDRPPSVGPYMRGYIVSISQDSVQVRWGIESYYLEQGQSAKLEEKQRKEMAGVPLYAQVAVASSGHSSVKSYDWAPLGMTVTFETKLLPPEHGARQGRRVATAVNVEVRNVSGSPVKIGTGENCFRLIPVDPPRYGYGPAEPRYFWVGADDAPASRAAGVATLPPGGKYNLKIDLEDPRWFVRVKKSGQALSEPISLSELRETPRCRMEYNPPRFGPEGSLDILHYIHLRSRAFNGGTVD